MGLPTRTTPPGRAVDPYISTSAPGAVKELCAVDVYWRCSTYIRCCKAFAIYAIYTIYTIYYIHYIYYIRAILYSIYSLLQYFVSPTTSPWLADKAHVSRHGRLLQRPLRRRVRHTEQPERVGVEEVQGLLRISHIHIHV